MKRLIVLGGLMMAPLLADAAPAQHTAMPAGMTHDEHLAQMKKEEMDKRGAAAMGFDQDAAVHHFVQTATGGVIRVQAKDSADAATRDAIRAHLRTIAGEFARGDFSKPFMTHAENPPGVETMQRLKASLTFRFEEIENGGEVRIVASSADAVQAVHDFLRYQITEHETGDPLEVRK